MNKPSTTIGNISLLDIDIRKPLEFKFNDHMKNLTILVGANGTGKSLMMKIVWALVYTANIYIVNGRKQLEEVAQTIMDLTLRDHEMTGTLRAHFEGNPVLALGWDEGKCISGRCDYTENITEFQSPVYMGSSLRTFQAIDYYLGMRKEVEAYSKEEFIEKLCKSYCLPEVITMERMVTNMPKKLSKELLEKLETFSITKDFLWPKGADIIGLDAGGFFITNGKDKNYLSRFGSGAQAIINMMINTG